MKKIYSLAAAMVVSSLCFSQGTKVPKAFSHPREDVGGTVAVPQKVKKGTAAARANAKSNVIYSYDFSDPTMAGWTQTSLNPDYQYFQWDTVGQTWYAPEPSLKFKAPSAANGFALLDIGSKSKAAVGDSKLIINPALVTLQSPVLDLSGVENVKVGFWQMFRHCCHYGFSLWLDISTDGGENFSTNNSINITDGVQRKAEGPAYRGGIEMNVVITDKIQENPSNVVLRFRWDSSTPDGNGQTSDVYFWLIDDIVIEENLDYEMELKQAYYGDPVNSFDYKQVPASQVNGYTLGARAKNNGNKPQTITVAAHITGPGYDKTFKSAAVSMAPLSDTNIFFRTMTNPPAGNYTVEYSFEGADVAKDQKTANNTGSVSFAVTDGLFSHDPGTWDGRNILAHYTKDSEYLPYNMGLIYNAFEDGTVYKIEVIFPDAANVPITRGQQVLIDFFELLDCDVNTPDTEYPLFTLYVDITEEMVTQQGTSAVINRFEIPDGGAPIVAGRCYFPMFSINGGDQLMNFAESGESDDNSYYVQGDLGGSGYRWYRGGDSPIIRLHTSETVGIKEKSAEGFSLQQNQPNPFHGASVVKYQLHKPGSVLFHITDLSGRSVKKIDRGLQQAGAHEVQLDADQMKAGIYFYTLTVNGRSVTKKMIISE